jgi:HicA toxin of bacterial toxin-antitoxin,
MGDVANLQGVRRAAFLADPRCAAAIPSPFPSAPGSPARAGPFRCNLTMISSGDTIIQAMSKKHRNTLQAVFADPVRSNIAWRDIEAMLEAAGAEVTEGGGSRVRIALNGVRAVFHRPHPQKETDKGAVRSMRRFLTEAGVTP